MNQPGMASPAVKHRHQMAGASGCFQCCRLNLRCDYERPTCTRCVRRGIECGYPRLRTSLAGPSGETDNKGLESSTRPQIMAIPAFSPGQGAGPPNPFDIVPVKQESLAASGIYDNDIYNLSSPNINPGFDWGFMEPTAWRPPGLINSMPPSLCASNGTSPRSNGSSPCLPGLHPVVRAPAHANGTSPLVFVHDFGEDDNIGVESPALQEHCGYSDPTRRLIESPTMPLVGQPEPDYPLFNCIVPEPENNWERLETSQLYQGSCGTYDEAPRLSQPLESESEPPLTTKPHLDRLFNMAVNIGKTVSLQPEKATRDNDLSSLLSQTPTSVISTPPTESGLDEKKARIIDGVVLHLQEKIKQVFYQARIRARVGQGEMPASTGQGGSSTSVTGAARNSDSAGQNRNKRKMGDRDLDDDEEDDADLFRPKRPADADPGQETPAYACPYFKYNPAMYKSARNCPGPGWPNVHRVK
ncbi:hypothetical protein B0T16DRAFT_245717 [Cercophora newfieldiana]|uniref:Zn(2)-C6 fungal-type domain-containing protein n=1 Tax=Cercophora newfieldiana TaxID=92897 RepID=A0AA40CJM4_9PEZI|nr:hypothetical protein B0T16DRAFT_245717 [Cercophora newfieldiana]